MLGLWVGAFLLIAVLWGTAAGDYVNNFRLPGTESQHAYDTLKEKFPERYKELVEQYYKSLAEQGNKKK